MAEDEMQRRLAHVDHAHHGRHQTRQPKKERRHQPHRIAHDHQSQEIEEFGMRFGYRWL